MNAKFETNDMQFMASQHIGKDLLAFMVQEFKAMPDVWQKLPQYKQDTIIERARERLQNAVERAVNLIISEGKTVVIGDLEGVNIKADIKATFIIDKGNETNAKDALYAAVGQACSIIVSDASAYTGGMHEIRGEADQRAMDLNSEYEEKEDMENYPADLVDAEVDDSAPLLLEHDGAEEEEDEQPKPRKRRSRGSDVE